MTFSTEQHRLEWAPSNIPISELNDLFNLIPDKDKKEAASLFSRELMNDMVVLYPETYANYVDLMWLDADTLSDLICTRYDLIKDMIDLNQVSRECITKVATKNPKLFRDKKFPTDRIYGHGWTSLLKRYRKYDKEFFETLYSFSNKTELRDVFRNNPRLVAKLTPEIMDNSPLTSKEWILFISKLIKNNGVSLSLEFKEYLEAEAVVCGLKSPATQPLVKAAFRIKTSRVNI